MPDSPIPDSPISEAPIVDDATVESLRELQQATGKDLLSRVFDAYLRTAPESLEGLRQACESGDLAAGADFAHSLKGSSGSAGAARMAELSRDLERGLRDEVLTAEDAASMVKDLLGVYEQTEDQFRSILGTLKPTER